VRTIIDLLLTKYQEAGGELRFKAGVEKILTHNKRAIGVLLESGEELLASQVFSSIGLPETMAKISEATLEPRVGKMTFLESLFVFDQKPIYATDATILFYNNSNKYSYTQAQNYFDERSAVICLPDNYEPHVSTGEGMVRVTYMANFDQWKTLSREDYLAKKESVAQSALALTKKLIPKLDAKLLYTDVFSPTTIEKYTWHFKGTVYGSIDKTRDGRTPIDNLFIIGTDQGFLGIVGAMLSGISMANLHGLMEQK